MSTDPNLYNIKYTPHVIDQYWKRHLTSFYTNRFNKKLQEMVELLSHKNKFEITLFDLQQYFDQLVTSDYFKASLGGQCDQENPQSPYYVNSVAENNCQMDAEHGYLFWNNSHPSGLVHALLGQAVASRFG